MPNFITSIAEQVRQQAGQHLRDQCGDRVGLRIVIESSAMRWPKLVINNLYSFTGTQTSFGANMLASSTGCRTLRLDPADPLR